MRIAIVDVGTNTTRLFIADVENDTLTDEVLRISRVTRLGAEVDTGGRLLDDALAREHAVLSDYPELISRDRVDSAVAVMTSAVRDAANGQGFAADVAVKYGLEVHVLSGDEEASLTYLGATDELDPTGPDANRTILVLDIGGGSTELVVGHGRTPDFHVSTQAGVVRQADRHIAHDPPTSDELAEVAQDARSVLERAVRRTNGGPGSSGQSRSPGRRRHWRRSHRTSSLTTPPGSTGTCSPPPSATRFSRLAAALPLGAAPRGARPAPGPRDRDPPGDRDPDGRDAPVRSRRGHGLGARHPARRGARVRAPWLTRCRRTPYAALLDQNRDVRAAFSLTGFGNGEEFSTPAPRIQAE